jgi:hypothetical protein
MLCRCEDHEWPGERTNTYVAKVEPAGSSNESIICGNCDQPGAIFLNRDEYYEYEFEDKRNYSPWKANTHQIRLSDTPAEVRESGTRSEDNPPDSEPDHNSAADTNWN